MKSYSHEIEKLLAPPFEWCSINGGAVIVTDAADRGGTPGGVFAVGDFAISKYLTTNPQFERFVQRQKGLLRLRSIE
jgi:hypothetical protein